MHSAPVSPEGPDKIRKREDFDTLFTTTDRPNISQRLRMWFLLRNDRVRGGIDRLRATKDRHGYWSSPLGIFLSNKPNWISLVTK